MMAIIDGPRRSGRTTAGLCAAVALAESHQFVNYVVWNSDQVYFVQDLLLEMWPKKTAQVNVVSMTDKAKFKYAPCVYDHHVTESLMRELTR